MDIKDSYLHGTVGVVKSISVSADKLTYNLADINNTAKTLTLPLATITANGLLSKSDKKHLNSLTEGPTILSVSNGTYTFKDLKDKIIEWVGQVGTQIGAWCTYSGPINVKGWDENLSMGTSGGSVTITITAVNNWSSNSEYIQFKLSSYGSQSVYYTALTSANTFTPLSQVAFTDSSITGNAATANKLKTSRKLWGQDFDGSADVKGSLVDVDYIRSNSTNGYFVGNRNNGLGATDGGLLLFSYGDTPISIYTNHAERIRITGGGNVGIGTDKPTSKLDIIGSLKCNQFFDIRDNSDVKKRLTLQVSGGVGRIYAYNETDSSYQALMIGRNDNKALNISSAGNVGINKDPSTEKLDVNGNVKASSFIGNLDGTYVNKLTGYSKAASAADLAATDTLNAALGKLEYKAGIAYSWYRTITDDDTDDIINKWDEVVDFVNGLDTDLTDEFVTRKTNQTITGLKTFQTSTGNIKIEDASVKIDMKLNGSWARGFEIINTNNSKKVESRFGAYGHGDSDGDNILYYTFISHGSQGYNNATLKIYGDKATISDKEIYHKGNLKNLSDLNDDVVSGKYLPLTGGTISNTSTGHGIVKINATNTTPYGLIGLSRQDIDQAVIGADDSYGFWIQNIQEGSNKLLFKIGTTDIKYGSYKIWHEGNDGSGSGLNADLLDGINSTGFLRRFSTWQETDNTQDANKLLGGSTFAYRTHNNTATTGVIVSFNSENWNSYTLQLQGGYQNNQFYFRNLNGDSNTWGTWNEILHAGNYFDFTVKKDGTGATGTWGINITGNAATATRLLSPYGYTVDESKIILDATTADALFTNDYSFSAMMKDHSLFNTTWATVWNFSAYQKFGGTQFAIRYNQQPVRAALRTYSQNSKSWGEWRELAFTDSSIQNSKYLLTQTEASEAFYTDSYKAYLKWINHNTAAFKFTNGTFQFQADKAVKLTNARTIWGQSFDGTANIENKPLSGVFESLSFSRENWNYICVPTTNGNLAFNIGIAGTDNTKMCILNNGNVGIGTTTPDSTLFVNGNIKVLNNQFLLNTSENRLSVMRRDRGGIHFYPGISDTELMRVDYEAPYGTFLKNGVRIFNTGYVALGNAVAAYPLHVVGEIYSTSGFIKASSSNDYILLGGGGHEDKSTFAKRKNMNDFIHYGNEFTFASPQYKGAIYINHRTASGYADGDINEYIFGDGKGGALASITQGSFSGSASSLKASTIITSSKFNLSNAEWTNTGYTFANLASGTYAIQVTSGTNLVASGIMSVYKNLEDSAGDEIPLHVYSNAGWRPYLRTYANKLQISSNDATAKERTVTIKIAQIL